MPFEVQYGPDLVLDLHGLSISGELLWPLFRMVLSGKRE